MVNEVKHRTEEIFDLISDIPDPEIPVISIKDLGILQCVEETDKGFCVVITPTYTACPAMKMIEAQILERCALHGINNVEVKLVYSPAWTTDWLNEEAKIRMREYGISPPAIACGKTNSKNEVVHCPVCNGTNVSLISRFGSTACKSTYRCESCVEPFEHFKCH